jgi:hypothetical protein
MAKAQIKLVKFLVKYSNKWHSFASDYNTVSLVCACSNLGILKTNNFGQMKLVSLEKADRWLAGKERG